MGLAALLLSAMMLCSCDLGVGDSPAQMLDVCNISAPAESSTYSYETSNSYLPDIIYYRVMPPNASYCMHYAWSVQTFPTLFISRTEDNCTSCNITFNREEYHQNQSYGSVGIPGVDGDFALAIVFHRLIEFRVTEKDETKDVFNSSQICNTSANSPNYTSVYLNETTNVGSTFSDQTELEWAFNLSSKSFVAEDVNTSLPFRVTLRYQLPTSTDKARLPYFPKSLFTENSTTFDLIVEHFPYKLQYSDSAYPGGRLALELLLVHGPNTSNGSIEMSRTIDDEHTPSVFQTLAYRFGKKGYLQWKPISYQTSSRASTKSQQANYVYASGTACNVSQLPPSLASALFDIRMVNATWLFMVFGTAGDDSALNSTYTTWTAVLGYGIVPQDELSLQVIIAILVGLGIPVIFIFIGAIYVIYKKKPWESVKQRLSARRRDYERLN